MDATPSHIAPPSRPVYPRFPGFALHAGKFRRWLVHRSGAAQGGIVWYDDGVSPTFGAIYSPSRAFAPSISVDGFAVAPSDTEINGCLHWGSSIYRTPGGDWVYVVDPGSPAYNPFEEWHLEPDPDDPDADPVAIYHGWGWWKLTFPQTFSFAGPNDIAVEPHGTLLNADHDSDRASPPVLEFVWDAFLRTAVADEETDGPGGIYTDPNGRETTVGWPLWTSEDGFGRMTGIRQTDGSYRFVADGAAAVMQDGKPIVAVDGILYIAASRPAPKSNVSFIEYVAEGSEHDENAVPFTATWAGYTTAGATTSNAWALDLPTVLDDLGGDA